MAQWPAEYQVDAVETKNGEWREVDFSGYDVVHVAGIAHQDTKADQEELYYRVNRDLTIEVAEKAKAEGVKAVHFYEQDDCLWGEHDRGDESHHRGYPARPTNFYGNSKLLAEQGILPLQSDDFNVVVLRPPMIYGKGSKGNYPLLAKFAKASPVFPAVENARSMLISKI